MRRPSVRRWPLAIRAGWLLTLYWGHVRLRPRAVLRRARPAPARHRTAPHEAARLVATVRRVAAIHPLRPGCLEQALAARRMLVRRGTPAEVVLGVRRDGALRAHAWVVVDGVALDPSAPDFHALACLDSSLLTTTGT